jgi:hypothetical protein
MKKEARKPDATFSDYGFELNEDGILNELACQLRIESIYGKEYEYS